MSVFRNLMMADSDYKFVTLADMSPTSANAGYLLSKDVTMSGGDYLIVKLTTKDIKTSSSGLAAAKTIFSINPNITSTNYSFRINLTKNEFYFLTAGGGNMTFENQSDTLPAGEMMFELFFNGASFYIVTLLINGSEVSPLSILGSTSSVVLKMFSVNPDYISHVNITYKQRLW